jgi:peptidoglycan/LPS O-acetylase OafA/YrhL
VNNEVKQKFKINNFDLIRLFAAMQVAIQHSLSHLEIAVSNNLLLQLLSLFPGVPIFFLISGFLISRSYESNPELLSYSLNRIFRIYPALIICTFLSVLSVYCTGYISSGDIGFGQISLWVLGQISFIQFYNPEFMRAFGTGVLNGSLWTISVELQFYLLTPLLYWLLKNKNGERSNFKLIVILIIFIFIHLLYSSLSSSFDDFLLFKLFKVSFAPWLYMFLIGVLFQRNFETIFQLFVNKFKYLISIYILFSYITTHYFSWQMGNTINPVLFLLLAISIFSMAYSIPYLSRKSLKDIDISYGIYIYHIPIINLFIYYGLLGEVYLFNLMLLLTFLLAVMSWFIIEKPILKYKKISIRRIQ